MNNEELKKKICDIIAPYVSAHGDDERIADALILGGIGYVWDITEKAEKAIASLIKQNKELQHRAEVVEKERDEYRKSTHIALKGIEILKRNILRYCVADFPNILQEAEREIEEEERK